VEDLARMELDRGESLSDVCNKEAREGLSQCIGTGRRTSTETLILVDTGDPGSGGDDRVRTPKVTCPITCFYMVAQLPLRGEAILRNWIKMDKSTCLLTCTYHGRTIASQIRCRIKFK
jgi:hypothetical protein